MPMRIEAWLEAFRREIAYEETHCTSFSAQVIGTIANQTGQRQYQRVALERQHS